VTHLPPFPGVFFDLLFIEPEHRELVAILPPHGMVLSVIRCFDNGSRHIRFFVLIREEFSEFVAVQWGGT